MFDIGGWELAMAAAVALVLIKPEDLPVVMRAIGRFVRKMRNMSREFYGYFDDVLDELDDNPKDYADTVADTWVSPNPLKDDDDDDKNGGGDDG